MAERFKERLRKSREVFRRCQGCAEAVEGLAEEVIATLKRGGKIVCFGNGGSAAQALHFAAELIGRFRREREGLAALALTADAASMTAIGNDYGFARVFERQVEALVHGSDLVIGLSTSGTSLNVLRGLERAKGMGARTALLTGARCPKVPEFVDICVQVPEAETAFVQEVHLAILHWLCERVDEVMGRGSESLQAGQGDT